MTPVPGEFDRSAADIAVDRQLDPRSVLFWQVENAVGILLLLVLALLAPLAPFVPDSGHRWISIAAIAVIAFALVEALVVIPRRYRYYRYALTFDSIVVEQGRLWQRRHVYPLTRILYCETRQGPILRLFNLFTVRAATIVDSRSIGPISKAEADRFEQAIRERSR